MQVQFQGKIKSGVFKLNSPKVFDAYALGQKDGNYYLTFHKTKGSPKTMEQLGYYYAVVVPTVFKQMVEDGNDKIVINIGVKRKDVPLTPDVVDLLLKEACAKGEKLKRNMTMGECSDFISTCILWAARYMGCVIPEPKDI